MKDESAFGDYSTDEFGQTDLVSNHTVFKDQHYYRALVRGHDLPVETFSSFIHEATHHWCFISPVGTALSLLYLSIAKKVLRWLVTGEEDQLKEALDDRAAFDIAVRWLRPLSEGLAQFAEYDVLPPYSGPLLSPPLTATLTHLFNLPRLVSEAPENDRTPAFYRLRDDINRWRLSRQTIERKSELLLQPIAVERSAYLLGYLTVKQLWRSAQRFYKELKDADVFLMFIRKLVWADYSLVAELLDRRQPGLRRGLRFGQALHRNLYAIRQMNFDEDVPWSQWEELLGASMVKGPSPLNAADPRAFAGLDTVELVEQGRQLQLEYFREAAEPFQFASEEFPFPQTYFLDLLSERNLMWLGQMDAKWESTGPKVGRIVAEDGVVYERFNLTQSDDRDLNDLYLDIYVDLYSEYQLTTVGNERGVFGFATREELSDAVKSDLMKKRLDRSQTAKLTALIHNAMQTYVRDTNYGEQLDKFWKDGGLELLNDSYLGFAFNFNDQARSAINENGLADVLQNDGELVRGVSAITLASSAEMSPEEMVLTCADLSLDPQEIVRRVRELWPEESLPLASINPDGFLISAF
jgi:hypothetical protein